MRCSFALGPRIARTLGLPIMAWTIKSTKDIERAQRSADNITFENVDPSAFRRAEPVKASSGTVSA